MLVNLLDRYVGDDMIGMPPPALLGLAIDTGIRVLRQKIKEEKV